MTREDQISYAVIYGEFEYKAATWRQPRRVCFKIEKPAGQMTHLFTFIVTNMVSIPRCVVQFYCERGGMENFIKESKNDFDFSAVSSSSFTVNENRLLAHALAYNIFNWFRRLVLPAKMKHLEASTLRLMIIKIAARVTWIRNWNNSSYKRSPRLYKITLTRTNTAFQPFEGILYPFSGLETMRFLFLSI